MIHTAASIELERECWEVVMKEQNTREQKCRENNEPASPPAEQHQSSTIAQTQLY